MQRQILNVSVVNMHIQQIFDAEEMLHGICVCGEVSGYKNVKGHAYFTLKDAQGQIACICYNAARTYMPKEGELVLVTARVDYYPKLGKLSLYCDAIEPYGAGLMAARLEKLRLQLEAEGLFADAHKIPIPKFCKRIGVVTSASGAVIHDIVTTIRRVNHNIDIVLYDVRVQGERCAEDVARGLRVMDARGYDAILVARGGGSAEELMPYNDEVVVRQIYACNTPILSAVGHESDVTLCDMVADMRCATPTAAAQAIAYPTDDIREFATDCMRRAESVCKRAIQRASEQNIGYGRMINRLFENYYSNLTSKLNQYITKINCLGEKQCSVRETELRLLSAKLDACNPIRILQRGYWRMQSNGKTQVGIEGLRVGAEVTMIGHSGKAKAKIMEIEYEA